VTEMRLNSAVPRIAGFWLCIVAIFVTAHLFALLAHAQSPAEIAKSLPQADQRVMARLSELNMLPSGEWRFHAGNVPHGESVSLDDSAWPVTKVGALGTGDAAWYRQWVEIPKTLHGYDLTGVRIWFQFGGWAHGQMPEIVYFNGRRVALGEDMEPIILFDDAKPGDKVLIAVKLLTTVDEKHFTGSEMKIDFAPNRPNPGDERTEFLSAALLVPSLSNNSAADEATLNGAITAVDLDALDAGDQAKFDASLQAAQQKLEALKPLLQQATFHVTGNSHIDAAWLWPWT
jgi:alpha-mannosidase